MLCYWLIYPFWETLSGEKLSLRETLAPPPDHPCCFQTAKLGDPRLERR